MTDLARHGNVLVLNAGSSSLKFVLIDPTTAQRPASGVVERIGTPAAALHVTRPGAADEVRHLDRGDYQSVVESILVAVNELPPDQRPTVVGHRVVHGGEEFSDSIVIDRPVVEAIERYSALAPLHNPPALLGIRAVSQAWPDVTQVAVFDTAFHQTMPARAYRYAVPNHWYEDYEVRKYGFHGTSHRYVSGRAAELLSKPLGETSLVVAHLGNGCSAAAIRGGRSVDTTMGLTPLEGLVMGTRSGDVDPAIFGYLHDRAAMSEADVTSALNKESGLLGLSGRTNDMREVREAAEGGDERAALAVDVFSYRLAKHLAGLVVALADLDALVFTGGIGENDASLRSRVLGRLGFLGLTEDADANAAHGTQTAGRITIEGNSPCALVVTTDEELMIALDARRLTS